MIFDRLAASPRAAISTEEMISRMRLGNGSTAGVPVTTTTAMRVAAVYACVRVLAETAGQLPFVLFERNGESRKRAVDHRLYSLLHDAPNDFQTSQDWRQTMTAHAVLFGTGYSYVNRSSSGDVLEMLPIHPDKIEAKLNRDWSITYTHTDPDGKKDQLRPDQVFRLTGFTLNGYTGVSPIQYHRETIGIALAASRHRALGYKNGAKMAGILSHPSRLDDPATQKRIRDSWDDATSGDNISKTAVLEEGMTWTGVTITPKDLQYIESQGFQVEEVARIFGVQPHKIQHLNRATFSNIEEQNREYVTNTYMPWAMRWEQSTARDLLRPEERKNYFAKMIVNGLMRGDSKTRAAFYHFGLSDGWLNPNTVREMEDMNPYDGGDEYMRPLNMGVNDGALSLLSDGADPASKKGNPDNAPA